MTDGCCFGSRISIPGARGLSSLWLSRRTWPGSGSRGRALSCASPTGSITTQALQSVLSNAACIYACAATRRDIADALATGSAPPARDPDGAPLYRPICGGDRSVSNRLNRRCLKTQGPFAKRLDMALAVAAALAVNPAPFAFTAWDGRDALSQQPAEPSQWGDAVIVRKDTPASYHLACVVDDAAQGITHIVRGADIAPSTGLHVLLQRLLDLPSPVYHHHDLLLGSDGEKLSKGNVAPSLRQMRADGATPETIREMVGVPNACA
jgi:glutamyl-Q tRNA(Asp) synthetase